MFSQSYRKDLQAMKVLPEIISLDDYEKMSNYITISKDTPGTIVSNHKVGYYDDFENEKKYGTLYYNGHGLRLVYEDGSSTNTGYNKFRYCSISDLDFNNFSVRVNDSWSLFFSDGDDLDSFLNYVDSLNYRTETFLDAAIDKVTDIFEKSHNIGAISKAIDNIINGIQEEFFIDDINYFIMLHHFTFADDIVRKYVDFLRDDTYNAYNILRTNREYGAIVSSIMNTIRSTVNVIQSNVDLLDEYVNFYLYLSIREGLVKKYSIIWENEYDNSYDGSDLKKYLIFCANECYITLNDRKSIFSFACFWIKNSKNNNDDIRNVISKIKSTVELKDCPTRKGNTLGSHKAATPKATPTVLEIYQKS